jgi:hypothetical protein
LYRRNTKHRNNVKPELDGAESDLSDRGTVKDIAAFSDHSLLDAVMENQKTVLKCDHERSKSPT